MRSLFNGIIYLMLFLVTTIPYIAEAAEFKTERLDNGTALIFVLGEIESGDEVAFRRLSVEHPKAIVALDSKGGKLMPAIEIGKIIRLAGYTTVVADDFVCTSSCALIWLAGSPRYLEPAGKIGFHASYRDNDGRLEETGVGNAVIGHYLSMLNLPQSTVIFATTASPKEITWLDGNNAQRAGIDYRVMTPTPKNDTAKAPTAPVIRTVTSPTAATKTVSMPPPLVKTVAPSSVATRTAAEYTQADFKDMFTRLSRDPKYLETVFSGMNLSGYGLDLMVEHANMLYADERYIDRLSSEIFQARAGFSGTENDRAIAMSIGQALNVKMMLNGLSRLSDNDIKLFLFYTTSVFANAKDSECKAIATGRDEFGQAELRLLQGLGRESFSSYLALTRRAITAELQNFPLKITPSKVEAAAGQKSFENYLESKMSELSEAEQIRLYTAISAIESAPDKDACDGYYMILRTAYDLGGMPGNWQRRSLINSMAE